MWVRSKNEKKKCTGRARCQKQNKWPVVRHLHSYQQRPSQCVRSVDWVATCCAKFTSQCDITIIIITIIVIIIIIIIRRTRLTRYRESLNFVIKQKYLHRRKRPTTNGANGTCRPRDDELFNASFVLDDKWPFHSLTFCACEFCFCRTQFRISVEQECWQFVLDKSDGQNDHHKRWLRVNSRYTCRTQYTNNNLEIWFADNSRDVCMMAARLYDGGKSSVLDWHKNVPKNEYTQRERLKRKTKTSLAKKA